MSTEPERPIEKLLRASAQQRREQTGHSWQMTPANRRRLHQEVSREFGRPTRSAFARGWLRPALALGAAVLLGLATIWITWRVFNPTAGVWMAKNEPAQVRELNGPAEVQPAPQGTGLAKNAGAWADLADNSAAKKKDAAAPPPEGAEPLRESATMAPATAPLLAGTLRQPVIEQRAQNVPAAPAANSAASLSPDGANNVINEVVQFGYFAASQTAHGAKSAASGSQPAGQVLVSFRVEQSGRQLRIIDNDGSVYSGPFQNAGRTSYAPAPQGAAAPASALGSQLAAARQSAETLGRNTQNAVTGARYHFQLVGTNRSSNQRVVFSGTLIAGTDLTGNFAANARAKSAKANSTETLSPSAGQAPVQNWRLSGTAVIGGTEEVGIEAVPSPVVQGPR